MLRSDLIYKEIRRKDMKIRDIAQWMDITPVTLREKLNDLSGKRMTVYEVHCLMLLLKLPVSVFINEDVKSYDEIEKAVALCEFNLNPHRKAERKGTKTNEVSYY